MPDFSDIVGDLAPAPRDPFADDPFDRVVPAIVGQESGRNYRAVNPDSGALGAYQVMPANLADWGRRHVGRAVTPREFLASPELQDTIARGQLRDYWNTALEASGGDTDIATRRTAAAWYSGNPNLYDSEKPQGGYPSIRAYTQSVLGRSKHLRGLPAASRQQAIADFGDLVADLSDAPAVSASTAPREPDGVDFGDLVADLDGPKTDAPAPGPPDAKPTLSRQLAAVAPSDPSDPFSHPLAHAPGRGRVAKQQLVYKGDLEGMLPPEEQAQLENVRAMRTARARGAYYDPLDPRGTGQIAASAAERVGFGNVPIGQSGAPAPSIGERIAANRRADTAESATAPDGYYQGADDATERALGHMAPRPESAAGVVGLLTHDLTNALAGSPDLPPTEDAGVNLYRRVAANPLQAAVFAPATLFAAGLDAGEAQLRQAELETGLSREQMARSFTQSQGASVPGSELAANAAGGLLNVPRGAVSGLGLGYTSPGGRDFRGEGAGSMLPDVGSEVGRQIGSLPYYLVPGAGEESLGARVASDALKFGGLAAVENGEPGETAGERGRRIAGAATMGAAFPGVERLVPRFPFASVDKALEESAPALAGLGERARTATAMLGAGYAPSLVTGQVPTFAQSVGNAVLGAGIGPSGYRGGGEAPAREAATLEPRLEEAAPVPEPVAAPSEPVRVEFGRPEAPRSGVVEGRLPDGRLAVRESTGTLLKLTDAQAARIGLRPAAPTVAPISRETPDIPAAETATTPTTAPLRPDNSEPISTEAPDATQTGGLGRGVPRERPGADQSGSPAEAGGGDRVRRAPQGAPAAPPAEVPAGGRESAGVDGVATSVTEARREPERGEPAATEPDSTLRRAYRAGVNQGTVEFASAAQRDLYDLGAELRYRMRGGRDKTSQRANKDVDAMTERVATSLGVTADEARRLAYDTHDDVRGQLRGIGDGETRRVADNVRGPAATATATARGASALQPEPEAPAPPPAAEPPKPTGGERPAVDENQFFNFERAGVSGETEQNLRALVRTTVAETGGSPKQRVGFDQIKAEAAAVDPELVRDLKPPAEGETLHPAVRLAARQELNRLNARAVELRTRLERERNRLAPDERAALEDEADRAEADAKNLISVLYPTRTQLGRNLAYERIMAEGSNDVDYWVSRARRQARRAGTDLDSKAWQAKEAEIRDALGRGTTADSEVAAAEERAHGAVDEMRDALTDEARTRLDARAKAAQKRMDDRGGCT